MLTHQNPLVSIIIPTYNRVNLLKRAVHSVLTQTYRNFELIIIDDHSQDSTRDYIRNLNHPKILYYRNPENKGSQYSRNLGLQFAKGEFIAYLDDDDFWFKQKLLLQIQYYFSNQNFSSIGLVYSGYMVYKDGVAMGSIYPKYEGNLSKKILKQNFIGSPTPIFKKDCIADSGNFDEHLPTCQDWDMWARIAQHWQIIGVNCILSGYSLHGAQKSLQITKVLRGRILFLKKHSKMILPERKIYADHLLKIAILLHINERKSLSNPYLSRSMCIYPFKLDNFMWFLVMRMFPSLFHSMVRLENYQTSVFILLFEYFWRKITKHPCEKKPR